MNNKYQNEIDLSIILPCQNEEEALPAVLNQCIAVLTKMDCKWEIIVSDSSTDRSPEIAREFNVCIVKHDKQGYGNAYLEAFEVALGRNIFMADCDGTYDFNEIPTFIKSIDEGYDFVIGDRFKCVMAKEAMPLLHKMIGNPLLSFLLRLFFKSTIRDVHCGMRAFKKEILMDLRLQTTGMEFASEMVIKVVKNKLKVKELPISYHKRMGVSKLKSFADGWRHLRFMLLYSPLFLFFFPGAILFASGLLLLVWFLIDNPIFFGMQFYVHPMFFASLCMIIGYQIMLFGLFAKTYAITHLREDASKMQKLYRYLTIENVSLVGLGVCLIGFGIIGVITIQWIMGGFKSLNAIKISLTALTMIALGTQTIFSSFMLSILGIKEKND